MRKCHAAAVWPGPVEWEQCVALIAVVAGCLARSRISARTRRDTSFAEQTDVCPEPDGQPEGTTLSRSSSRYKADA
jgi:hypothetical protein